MKIDDTVIRLRVKEILAQKGMTSKELAERMNKAPQYVSNIINGGKGVSISTLVGIAQTLDVEFRDLFSPIKQKVESVNGFVKIRGTLYEVNSFDDIERLLALKN